MTHSLSAEGSSAFQTKSKRRVLSLAVWGCAAAFNAGLPRLFVVPLKAHLCSRSREKKNKKTEEADPILVPKFHVQGHDLV